MSNGTNLEYKTLWNKAKTRIKNLYNKKHVKTIYNPYGIKQTHMIMQILFFLFKILTILILLMKTYQNLKKLTYLGLLKIMKLKIVQL